MISELRTVHRERRAVQTQTKSTVAASLEDYLRLLKSETKRPTIPRRPTTRYRPKFHLPLPKPRKLTPPPLSISTRDGPSLRRKFTAKLVVRKSALWQPLRLQSFQGGESDPGFRVIRYEHVGKDGRMEGTLRKSEGVIGKTEKTQGKSATPEPKIGAIELIVEDQKEIRTIEREFGPEKQKKTEKRLETAGNLQGWEVSPRNISPVFDH